jgi:2',3'-cyclic-nucleotide 2'-phosphodiesterase/3'-nucleotidase
MKKVCKQKVVGSLLAASLAFGALAFPLTPVMANTGSTLKLRLLETTDIHVNIVNYDYYQDKATDEFGLAKAATLIKKAREEAKNSLLFDNGDLIQGNPLGDYVAKVDPLQDGETHPVYKAMNLLDYDAGNIGNHEFNFGLEHLQRSLKGSKFPYVNANVYVDDKDNDPANDKNYFTPYLILDKTFQDESGKDVNLKVGVIGFVPPQIMVWDKSNLEGKVIAKDIVETAKKYIPEMKAKGADIIVAVPHSGLGNVEGGANLENASYQLSKVEGIDAILFGHSHSVFPGAGFDQIEGVDNAKGTVNGVPAVMPGFWGNHLGVIDLTLQQVDGKWKVVDSISQARPIYDKTNKKSLADVDQSIVDAVKDDHDHTVEWVRSAVGTTTAPIHSFFALVQDDPSIQIVTNAQKWFVEKNIKGTEYDGIPVLSAGAPFKAGGRGGATYYTNIPAGTIAIKNVADLYIYPNTLKAVLVNGATVQEWLERSAGQFNQISTKKDPADLVAVGDAAREAKLALSFDAKTKQVTLKNDAGTLAYVLGAKDAVVNGKKVAVAAKVENGKLHLPIGLLESTFKISLNLEQALINDAFPTYNFDVIDGVTYQIDVTEPSRYDKDGKLVNEKANRIKNLMYNGKKVKPEDKFIVVTNNYRAGGGGNFPGLDGKNIVIDSPDENRQIVIDYILANKTINPSADNNWSFAPINGKANVTFTTSPDAKAFAEQLPHIKYISTLDSGFAKYFIDLSKK